jgi:hypothetical protein
MVLQPRDWTGGLVEAVALNVETQIMMGASDTAHTIGKLRVVQQEDTLDIEGWDENGERVGVSAIPNETAFWMLGELMARLHGGDIEVEVSGIEESESAPTSTGISRQKFH